MFMCSAVLKRQVTGTSRQFKKKTVRRKVSVFLSKPLSLRIQRLRPLTHYFASKHNHCSVGRYYWQSTNTVFSSRSNYTYILRSICRRGERVFSRFIHTGQITGNLSYYFVSARKKRCVAREKEGYQPPSPSFSSSEIWNFSTSIFEVTRRSRQCDNKLHNFLHTLDAWCYYRGSTFWLIYFRNDLLKAP